MADAAPVFYGLTNGFNQQGAGSVVNLLDPSTYSYTVGNFGSPGLGGLTAPAAAAFQNFTAGAFNSLQSQGAANFAFLGQLFSNLVGIKVLHAEWFHQTRQTTTSA